MKKLAKRSLLLMLTVAMIISCFAGCGKTGSDKTTTAAATAAATTSKNTLVIGGIGPLTGAAATYGTAVKNGAQLAIDEINAAGGVNGMTLALNFQDDEHDAEKAINAYNTIKDAGAKLLIGTVTSTPCISVVEKTHKDKMFQITPSGSAIDCIKYDNAFRICFNDPNQGTASAQYIASKKIASKVAIIYDSSDVYSSGIRAKFVAEAANQKLNVVTEQAFNADSNTDFSVALQQVQQSGADLVFLPIYYQQAALILQQANKIGLDVKFFGCDGLDGVITQLGKDSKLAEGVMLLTPFVANATDAKTVAFVTAYKAANNNELPNQFAADGYDAVYSVKAALEKAGISDASISVSDLCDKLSAAMFEIEVAGVTGTMTWSADREPTKPANAMIIKDGNYSAIQ